MESLPVKKNLVWEKVQTLLQQEFGEAAYRSWLQPIYCSTIDTSTGETILSIPTKFMRDWIKTHYLDRIIALLSEFLERPAHIEFVVDKKPTTTATDSAIQPAANLTAPNVISLQKYQQQNKSISEENPNDWVGQYNLMNTLDSRFTFDNFVVGKSNELAHAAARRVAESEGVPFNPLFLYGGVGLGKTHLMHAIGHAIAERTPNRRVIYLSAEKFMYAFIRSLRFKDVMSFKEQFRSVDVLMIDDVQFIAGKESTQEEFFHTFNALVDQNRQVIVSADKSPSDLEGLEDRMKSRLGWGLVADIHPTTYELRLGILQSKIEFLSLNIPDKVLEFLAHKIASNVRELEGALIRLKAHADLTGHAITLDLTQDVLSDILRANDKTLSIEDIQKKVAEHFHLKVADLTSARRAQNITRPRHIAMYLAKKLTSKSLPEIGRSFGGRDHAAIIHAVKRVESLQKTNHEFAQDVTLLFKMLDR